MGGIVTLASRVLHDKHDKAHLSQLTYHIIISYGPQKTSSKEVGGHFLAFKAIVCQLKLNNCLNIFQQYVTHLHVGSGDDDLCNIRIKHECFKTPLLELLVIVT